MEHPAIKHPYIVSNSGLEVDVANLTPETVSLPDIYHALSNQCRYNGHTNVFYSVAEHSVLVARMAALAGQSLETQIAALLHDAHEAYVSDLPSPHKNLVDGWRGFEACAEDRLREILGLPAPWADVWRVVKEFDTAILFREAKNLFNTAPRWYNPNEECAVPAELQPIGLSPEDARGEMQNLHEALLHKLAHQRNNG